MLHVAEIGIESFASKHGPHGRNDKQIYVHCHAQLMQQRLPCTVHELVLKSLLTLLWAGSETGARFFADTKSGVAAEEMKRALPVWE